MRKRPVLISGAGVAAGAYCAEALAEWGARPFIIERNVNRANAVAARTSGFAVVGDVTDVATVERAVNAATLAGGGLSGLVHAIRRQPGLSLDSVRADEFRADFTRDVLAIFALGRTSLRAMRLDRRGLLLRLDYATDEEHASARVLAAAQASIWDELRRFAAELGVRVETLAVPPDEEYAETATRVVELFDEVFPAAEADMDATAASDLAQGSESEGSLVGPSPVQRDESAKVERRPHPSGEAEGSGSRAGDSNVAAAESTEEEGAGHGR